MAPHSSTLAWKSPWEEEPDGLQSMGSWRVGHDWVTSLSLFTFIGEGNGNPLQCSCLEIPRTGEPGGLPSTGSNRVGHDWSDLAAAAAAALSGIHQVVQKLLLHFWKNLAGGGAGSKDTKAKERLCGWIWDWAMNVCLLVEKEKPGLFFHLYREHNRK